MRMTLKAVAQTILLGATVAIFTGCASMPSADHMRAEVQGFILPKLPEQGKALVYVVRPAVTGTLIRFNVFLDDKEANSEMGYTRGKQYIYFNVEPGKHNILSKAENWASVEVDAKAGDVFFIQQEVNMGIVMARNNLFRLEDYQGKYHVKRLQLGTILKSDR